MASTLGDGPTADARLNPGADVVALTATLVDIPSVSGSEAPISDAVEQVLRRAEHLSVVRDGNCVVARTELGRAERVVIAGHLDTVPASGNLPHQRLDGNVSGLGSCDMKGGVAVSLRLALDLAEPTRDVTYVYYDCEEVEEVRNGLGRLAREHPDWLAADLAILMEPSAASIEAGCQGTLRAEVTARGRRAHSARAWLGDNAIHAAVEILHRLTAYEPRRVVLDGLEYREGLNAVGIRGGVAGNVVPDECVVTVNYRFAPSLSVDSAREHVEMVFAGFGVEVVDVAAGALPGLHLPAARDFVAAVGSQPRPKFGWTDVARFSSLGIPAVNFGPGDPALAHTREEFVPEADLRTCEATMRDWLTG